MTCIDFNDETSPLYPLWRLMSKYGWKVETARLPEATQWELKPFTIVKGGLCEVASITASGRGAVRVKYCMNVRTMGTLADIEEAAQLAAEIEALMQILENLKPRDFVL